MKKIITATIVTMVLAACSSNPFFEEWDTPYGIPPFDKIKNSHYVPALKAGIEEYKAQVEAIVSNEDTPTFDNTIAALELSGGLLAKVAGVLFNVAETDNSPELEAIMEEVTPLLTAMQNEISMNKGLFERVKIVYENLEGLDREQQMVVKGHYESFTRSGVDLPQEAQAELKEINTRLAMASQKFGTNLLAENNAFKDECGVAVSSYPDEMASCTDRERREKLFKAYSSRGNHDNEYDNKALCLEVLRLRARKAELLGFKNYAAYQLDDKMAHDPETVDAFLAQIMDASMRKAREEVADMQKVMDEDVAAGLLPEGSRIEPWDWFYYAERVRKAKYDLNEELTRPYFLLENVRNGAFAAAHKLYGINVEPIEDAPVYNPEVKAFKLTDSDGSFLGVFLCDYLPRSSKRGGAWMNNVRDQYQNASGEDVRPIIVNVGNLTPPTQDRPSLITIDEVTTIFHEFGHALHGFLSKCRYPSVSGTNVTRDFVETFSQFNENWAFQPEILSEYAHHYQTGEEIPDSLVAKINNSLKFNQGFTTGELAAASVLDMKWHELTSAELEDIDIAEFEAKVCRDMGLIDEIIPRYRTTYFNHIIGSGYAAGYYSYLWTEVLDKDAFAYFKEHGIYNPEVALKFRQTFLEKGGSEEPMTLYISFTGREPNSTAMLEGRGLN